jgi:hypothetical protein
MIALEKVASAYNGRIGCMCGCIGDYAYASDYREQAGKERGYALSDEDVSDRKLKIRLNKLNKMIAAKDYNSLEEYDFGVFVEKNGRALGVYFKSNG